MKSRLILLIALLSFGIAPQGMAQVLTPEDDGIIPDPPKFYHHNRVIQYPFLREADMVWSTRHWEIIDIREKINQHLYYPIKDLPDRKSLFEVLVDGILSEGTIVEVFRDDLFRNPMTPDALEERINRIDTVPLDKDFGIIKEDPSTYFIDTTRIRSNNVLSYKIKSDWYFDKQRGEMKNRIIAIAPVVKNEKSPDPYELFWVWFPDARVALHTHTTYNRNNRKQRLTFDEVFHLRYFNSVVYKEDNVYDRAIADYKINDTMMQLLEAQQIRENLRNFEHDLWEY
jgi:gliding motility associated protien GldN